MANRILGVGFVILLFAVTFFSVTRMGVQPESLRAHARMPQAGLLVYYPFDGNAVDHSGHGHDGILYGARPTVDRHGVAGAALSFDGVDDYVQIQPNKTLSAISISVWLRGKALPYAVAYYQGNQDCSIGHDGEGRIFFGVILADHNLYSITGPKASPHWTHIVGLYQAGETLRLYVNDALIDSLHAPPLLEGYPTQFGSSIGAGLGGALGFYDGDIDDFRIYNRLLSSAEIHLLYRE